MPIGYIYETTNLLNGKKYIGLKASAEFKPNYLGSGRVITNAVKKYGKSSFEVKVLEWCETYEELIEREVYYLQLFNCAKDRNYYNIIDTKVPMLYGKENGFYGKKHTAETKALLSKQKKGTKFSDERKKQISIHSQKVWDENPHLRTRLSERMTGRYVSEETRKKLSAFHSGKVVSEEARKKISKAKMGVKIGPQSEETKRKRLASWRSKPENLGNKQIVGKKVYHDPITGRNSYYFEGEQPDGLVKGKLSIKGKTVYHDPITLINKYFHEDEVPDGYVKGKIMNKDRV